MIGEAFADRTARLLLSGITPQKAKITNLNVRNPLTKSIYCHFNPAHITYTRDVLMEQSPVQDSDVGRYNYVGGTGAKLTLELLFDTTDTGDDVRKYTDFLVKLTLRDSKTKQPPKCKFQWGKFTSGSDYMAFEAIIADMDLDFTWFLPNGRPVRATARVTFKEYEETDASALPGQNPTSYSEARKIWTVVEGQTLDWIAYEEYGDPAQWRHIAVTNNLMNPKDLRAGQILKLVPLP